MAWPNPQPQNQYSYQEPSQHSSPHASHPADSPYLHPQNSGSLSSIGNIAHSNSIQVPGGIYDSGTRVWGYNLHLNFPSPVTPQPTESHHRQKVGDDGPIGLLHEVNSLKPLASKPPDVPTRPVEEPRKEAWQRAAGPVGNPSSRSLPLCLPNKNDASADRSSPGFVEARLKTIWSELRAISTCHKSIAGMVQNHKYFILDIWALVQGQIATVKTQKQILLDEIGYWDDSELSEELKQLLDNLVETLRKARQHLVRFTMDLEKFMRDTDLRILRKQLKRLRNSSPKQSRRVGANDIKRQLDGFRSKLRIISDIIFRFKDLSANFLEIAGSISLSEADGDETDEDNDGMHVALENLRTSRHASASLYQQLGQVCPEHREHRCYFHLQLDEPKGRDIQCVEFRLSVERKNINDDGPERIWFCAQASLLDDEEEVNGSGLYQTTSSRTALSLAKLTRPSLPRRSFNTKYGISQQLSIPCYRNHKPRHLPTPKAEWRRTSTGRVSKSSKYISDGRYVHPTLWRRGLLFGLKLLPPGPVKENPRPRPLQTGTSCLESLSQGKGRWAADLPKLEESGRVSCRLLFPSAERLSNIAPITLLKWIRKTRDCRSEPTSPSPTKLQLMCIRVAKQIVRSVLGLSPNFWPQQRPLQTSDILILDRDGSALEPLLDVHFVKNRIWNTTEVVGMPTSQQADCKSRHVTPGLLQSQPAITLRIAIILLELAYLEEMPQLRETEQGDVNRNHENFHEVRRKCDLRKSFGGDAYARAVKHCFDFNGSAEEFFSNEQHQRRFYREVVVGLEKAERNALEALNLQDGS